MKTEIAIALIVCGTILIAVPPASDYLMREQVTRIITQKPEASNVYLGNDMSQEYRLGCWFVGAAMVAVSVIASLGAARRRSPVELVSADTAGIAPAVRDI
jgi:hypothetical protein